MKVFVGSVKSRVEGPPEVIEQLRQEFVLENDYMTRQRSETFIPQYTALISKKGSFPQGLSTSIIYYLRECGHEVEVVMEREVIDIPNKRVLQSRWEDSPFKPRPYQQDAIIQGLLHYHGVFDLSTGAGKTLIMAFVIAAWNVPTLILVNRKELAQQLREEVAEYIGISVDEVGFIGDGQFRIGNNITVGMVQSLNTKSKLRAKQIKEYLSTIKMVVTDEVHNCTSPSYKNVYRQCTNAAFNFGFTATYIGTSFSGESGKSTNDIMITAYVGPIIASCKTSELIDRGYLCRPIIRTIANKIDFDGEVMELYSQEYERYLMRNDERNALIAKVTQLHYQQSHQTIIFISRVEHGSQIMDRLLELGVDPDDVAIVTGETFSSSRAEAIAKFKQGNLPILIGTVLNEGLNFFCDVGINAAGSDNERSTIQRLGRILRIKPGADLTQPQVVLYYDFCDKSHPYFGKHWNERRKIYQKEGHTMLALKPTDVGSSKHELSGSVLASELFEKEAK